jgi:biopolymer transport protein ExbB
MTLRRWMPALLLLLVPKMASAWWNEEWGARKQLRVDLSAAGAAITEPVTGAPVLVRLHSGNFKFELAKDDGSDLRFIASDDKTPLPFHFEKYDALLGEALVWLSIPDLKPGAKSEVWLYYKNPKATSAEDAKATYDKSASLVWHFVEKGQPPRDATAWANHGAVAGTAAEGALIGRGLRLEGTTLALPAGPALNWAAGEKLTWSVWLKPQEATASGVLFSRRDTASALVIGLEGGKPYARVEAGSQTQAAVASAPLPANAWHHLAVVAGDTVALFVDGNPVGKAAAALPALASAAQLGGDPADPKKPAPFKGEIDELEIAKVQRPLGFLQLSVLSQGTDPGKLISFGQDEESGGWSSGYFAVILRSVTLDGWVVIGLLGIMSAVSWLVMATKAAFLSSVQRANDRFSERFAALQSELAHLISQPDGDASLGDEKVQRNSSLLRLFKTCAAEMRHRTHDGRPLTAEGIESIRASLDATLVRENQKLSAQMVLLTIAISGGPFLGLLGTVVGVMITFAAIAAAGDVNVNAIAPGIAAALVATVAGLAVAIPSLFGYNWLLVRSKNISAVQQVFADELIAKAAEAFSERETHAHARPSIAAGAE